MMDSTPPAGPPPVPNPFEPPHGASGRPRLGAHKPLPLMGTILGMVAVVVAGMIAFVGTCFPVTLVAVSIVGGPKAILVAFWLPLIAGAGAALWAWVGTYRLIFRSERRSLPSDEGNRP